MKVSSTNKTGDVPKTKKVKVIQTTRRMTKSDAEALMADPTKKITILAGNKPDTSTPAGQKRAASSVDSKLDGGSQPKASKQE